MTQKQAVSINFAQGLDLKNDPYQISVGNFLLLENSVFTIGKRLTKRNGYDSLASLPNPSSYLTTFDGALTALGSTVQTYSDSTVSWFSKGQITPIELSTSPMIRNNFNQSAADMAISPSGLMCTVYTESTGSVVSVKYAVADLSTGQNIVNPTAISSASTTYTAAKVFVVGGYFVILYTNTSSDLSWLALNISTPLNAPITGNIAAPYSPATSCAFDAVVFNGNLYIGWNTSSGIRMVYMYPNLSLSANKVVDASHNASVISLCADAATSIIWASYYSGSTGYSVAVDSNIVVKTYFPTEIITSGMILNIASCANSGVATILYEVSSSGQSSISLVTVQQSSGTVSSPQTIIRSLGLASKAFSVGGIIYVLGAYSSSYQPTYFLVNASLSTQANPVVVAKLAYENGGGYLTTGLPNATVSSTSVYIPYLYKDLVEAIANANASGTLTNSPVYSQTGVNMVTFNFTSDGLVASEIGSNLNIGGGFLWGYDGYSLTENNFHLWPDTVTAVGSATSGSMTAQQYYYQVTYEWTDNQGNAFRSAGSIPVTVTLSSQTSVLLTIPTLRITAKTNNPAKIVIYRWSTAYQTFYQTTSITAPLLNDTTVDSVTYTDLNSDASILGNNILYTTGGVLEDTGAPASSAMTLFDDRLWLVDSEDPNLLWFSKQVIEATPVEMSDLLTMYIAPTIGATGPTGPIKALSAMDDKLIIFKSTAAYYINGTGPDNTGSNSQYSSPTFITAMVGCSNQRSIVFQPQGLMFEFASDAGNQIWMLDRNLSTNYIGAPVQALTLGATVLSAVAVPGTNQVRFNMSTGITLMYDYYYGQWGTFTTNGISSTIYNGLHTFINPYGNVLQETPNQYLDISDPVLVSMTTGWINIAGLQGYERFYEMYLLATYLSPHFLQVTVAYDYNPSIYNQALISPTNFSPSTPSAFGIPTPVGSGTAVEQYRIHAKRQLCESFQISITEVYNPAYGTVAGAGLSISGLSCIVGVKSAKRPIQNKPSSVTMGGGT